MMLLVPGPHLEDAGPGVGGRHPGMVTQGGVGWSTPAGGRGTASRVRTPGQAGERWGAGGKGNSGLPGAWRRCELVRFRSAGPEVQTSREARRLSPKPGELGSSGTQREQRRRWGGGGDLPGE